ncbi:MAG: phosphoglycerate dehydrogenase [Dehalococcoidia bacterium]|nr:phosphoglycerate dehydrogenase [Dehalococcoidia bacterium]
MAKVLVADSIAQEGIDLLRKHHDVEVKTGLNEEQLCAAVKDAAALVVRSATTVTAKVIAAGIHLEVIARAGVGVDNVDVDAATEAGIVVVNAPLANTMSAAEHTFGLMLALARNIPQGHASLQAGRWDRGKYMGIELSGRTLGIVGLGRIGTEVAKRARAFEMRVLAFDPYVSDERFSALGIERRTLDEILQEADFVTLHTALQAETRALINAERLAGARKGIRIINAARGALIDEEALAAAVESGQVAGAAIDVFSEEPAVGNVLTKSDKIVVTPHLAASTIEAQDRAGVDVAEQVIDILAGGAGRFPVNIPTVAPESMSVIGPYIEAASAAARLARQLAGGALQKLRVEYRGEIANHPTQPLKVAAIVGMLDGVTDEKVSPVNAQAIANARSLRIEEDNGPAEEPYASLVTVIAGTDAGDERVTATHTADGVRIVRINEYSVDVRPGGSQRFLAVENIDRPGTIGRVGTLMGQREVNISSMSVAAGAGGRALMLIGISRALTDAEVAQVRALDGIDSVRQISL